MRNQTFTLPRRGLVGGQPVGADYMQDVERRAARLERAVKPSPACADTKQLRLPICSSIAQKR